GRIRACRAGHTRASTLDLGAIVRHGEPQAENLDGIVLEVQLAGYVCRDRSLARLKKVEKRGECRPTLPHDAAGPIRAEGERSRHPDDADFVLVAAWPHVRDDANAESGPEILKFFFALESFGGEQNDGLWDPRAVQLSLDAERDQRVGISFVR